MTTQNTAEDWLKSDLAELNRKISGEQDLIQLAENIIGFLPPYLEAQVGALYLLVETDGEMVLEMAASHAYVWRSHADTRFTLGQGLVGQAAREHNAFVLSEPPPGYLQIESGLGKADPRAVLVIPFLYENE